MSIDICVFPTNPEKFCWGELRKKIFELLNSEDIQKLEQKSLRWLGSDKIMLENENISFLNNKDRAYFYLPIDASNSLGINIRENEPNYVSEKDMLEDFARNLDAATIQALIQKWKTVGYVYGVDSNGSKIQYEPFLLTALATAIAFLCEGYVIVMSNDFTLDIGVYTPEEFQKARTISSTEK
ncbi:MAG: hypothetical protein ACFCAD_11325 [Pleurocapsa sp.]